MRELDYIFLLDYIQYEIQRLSKAAHIVVLHKNGYLNDRDRAFEQTPQLHRDWQFGRRIKKLDALLEEAQIKLNQMEPRIEKLKEQETILRTLV